MDFEAYVAARGPAPAPFRLRAHHRRARGRRPRPVRARRRLPALATGPAGRPAGRLRPPDHRQPAPVRSAPSVVGRTTQRPGRRPARRSRWRRGRPGRRVVERDATRGVLDGLAPRARAILVLRYYADLDDHAIAEVLGVAESTVRVTASRALASLARGARAYHRLCSGARRSDLRGAAMTDPTDVLEPYLRDSFAGDAESAPLPHELAAGAVRRARAHRRRAAVVGATVSVVVVVLGVGVAQNVRPDATGTPPTTSTPSPRPSDPPSTSEESVLMFRGVEVPVPSEMLDPSAYRCGTAIADAAYVRDDALPAGACAMRPAHPERLTEVVLQLASSVPPAERVAGTTQPGRRSYPGGLLAAARRRLALRDVAGPRVVPPLSSEAPSCPTGSAGARSSPLRRSPIPRGRSSCSRAGPDDTRWGLRLPRQLAGRRRVARPRRAAAPDGAGAAGAERGDPGLLRRAHGPGRHRLVGHAARTAVLRRWLTRVPDVPRRGQRRRATADG